MKHHYDFLNIYNTFQAYVETKHSTITSALGKEHTFNAFHELLTSHGTIHHMPCIDTSEQNGVVERKHRHVVETTHSLLLFVYVSTQFW